MSDRMIIDEPEWAGTECSDFPETNTSWSLSRNGALGIDELYRKLTTPAPEVATRLRLNGISPTPYLDRLNQ